jgi:hypothetical protein
MLIDLQTHSSYSDGYLTPRELAAALAREGIKVAALTDHNSINGQAEFFSACKKFHIKAVAGLELYASFNHHKFNLLWYGFDYKNPDLNKLLLDTQGRSRHQCQRALEKLLKRGFQIDIDRLLNKYEGYIPINHLVDDIRAHLKNREKIALDLKKKSPREEEIIYHYFYSRKISDLGNSYVNFQRVINLRKKIGGVLILCHPCKHGRISADLLRLLKKKGLNGIEILSPHHSISDIMYLQDLGRSLNLIESGGSDFHRFENKHYPLRSPYQWFRAESKLLRGIEKIIK